MNEEIFCALYPGWTLSHLFHNPPFNNPIVFLSSTGILQESLDVNLSGCIQKKVVERCRRSFWRHNSRAFLSIAMKETFAMKLAPKKLDCDTKMEAGEQEQKFFFQDRLTKK